MSEPVVISAGSFVTALGQDLDSVWNALLANRSGIAPIQGFDASAFPCRSGAEVSGLDADSLEIPRREARIMNRPAFVLMKCTARALEAAGASDEGESTGFFAALGMVDYAVEDLLGAVAASRDERGGIDYDRFYRGAYREIFPLWPLSMLNNIALCQVAVRHRLEGENTVFSPHGDAGIQAIAEAAASVAEGRAERAIAAGVSETLSASSLARAHLKGIVNVRDQETPCRPFAVDRAGTVLGEGGGALVLERASRAPHARVRVAGAGTAFGRQGQQGPSMEAMTQAMATALQRAAVPPGDVDLVMIHGDGTRGGDGNEIEAIRRVFAEVSPKPRLFGSKGALGNLLAGAPLVDLVLAAKMMASGVIPPTPGTSRPTAEIAPQLVVGAPLAAAPRTVLINAFSYEGQAGSLVITALD